MGIGPQQAILRALQRAGIDLDEVGLIEINEAFAPQVLARLKLLGLDYEDPRVNPHGGAIAPGHPLGASGARLVLTAPPAGCNASSDATRWSACASGSARAWRW